MKMLFVCSQGMYRSPTARDLWKQLHPEDEVESVGVLAVDNDD